jgi:hypothetical protein
MYTDFALPEAALGPDEDFVLWGERQAALLRARQLGRLDLPNLVRELEELVGHVKNQLGGRLAVLMAHLLKCQFQPVRRTHSWETTLLVQRIAIARLLKNNPSLRAQLLVFAHDEYPAAVKLAARETHLPRTAFPTALPYTAEQLLDDEFVP